MLLAVGSVLTTQHVCEMRCLKQKDLERGRALVCWGPRDL